MANNETQTTIERLPGDDPRHRPIPPPIAYPADYGLANVTDALIYQYGRDGAVNRLVEMAERISNGERPGDWVFRRRRVDPTDRIIAERRARA
jgi:hypothetical protein